MAEVRRITDMELDSVSETYLLFFWNDSLDSRVSAILKLDCRLNLSLCSGHNLSSFCVRTSGQPKVKDTQLFRQSYRHENVWAFHFYSVLPPLWMSILGRQLVGIRPVFKRNDKNDGAEKVFFYRQKKRGGRNLLIHRGRYE